MSSILSTDPTEQAEAIKKVATGVLSNYKLAKQERHEALHILVVAGVEAVREYGQDVGKLIANRMKSRLIDWFRKEGTRAVEVLTASPGEAIQEEYEIERVTERLDAERTVVEHIWESDDVSFRQKEILRALEENDFDRSKTANALGITMSRVNQVLADIRGKLVAKGVTHA